MINQTSSLWGVVEDNRMCRQGKIDGEHGVRGYTWIPVCLQPGSEFTWPVTSLNHLITGVM